MKNKNYYREIRKSFCGVKKGNQRLFAKVLKAFEKDDVNIHRIASNGYNSRFYLEPEQLIGFIEYHQEQFLLEQQNIYRNGWGEEFRLIPLTANFWECVDIPKKTVSLYNKLYKRYN